MYGTMSGIPKVCKVQKTSGYREVKKPAPKVIPGLNPSSLIWQQNTLDGVSGTVTFCMWISKHPRVSLKCDP